MFAYTDSDIHVSQTRFFSLTNLRDTHTHTHTHIYIYYYYCPITINVEFRCSSWYIKSYFCPSYVTKMVYIETAISVFWYSYHFDSVKFQKWIHCLRLLIIRISYAKEEIRKQKANLQYQNT